jgi:inorganic pyrophosphatase
VEFDVVIEIPKGQRNKYEMDHETGRIRLDRMLFTSTRPTMASSSTRSPTTATRSMRSSCSTSRPSPAA